MLSNKLNNLTKLNNRCYDIDSCQECLDKHELHMKENEKTWFIICCCILLSVISVFFILFIIVY